MHPKKLKVITEIMEHLSSAQAHPLKSRLDKYREPKEESKEPKEHSEFDQNGTDGKDGEDKEHHNTKEFGKSNQMPLSSLNINKPEKASEATFADKINNPYHADKDDLGMKGEDMTDEELEELVSKYARK